MVKFLFLVFLSVYPRFGQAAVTVLFIENSHFVGNPDLEWEPGSKFYHVAISYKDKWLHVHPYYGVQLADLDEALGMGTGGQFVILFQRPSLTDAEVKPFLGLKFDRNFEWRDSETVYCSELVGKLLNISPLPMKFESPAWQKLGVSNIGQLGLSPDDLFAILRAEPGADWLPSLEKKRTSTCAAQLKSDL